MLTWQHIQQCQPCQHILDLVLSKMNGNKHSVTEYSLTFMYPYNLRRYFMFSWRRIFCHFVTFDHFSSYLKPSIIIFLSFSFNFISNHHNRYTLGMQQNTPRSMNTCRSGKETSFSVKDVCRLNFVTFVSNCMIHESSARKVWANHITLTCGI